MQSNAFPNDKSSKLKEFADDNIKFEENCRKEVKRGGKSDRKRESCKTLPTRNYFLHLKRRFDNAVTIRVNQAVKVPIAANWKGVCLQNSSNPIHTILKYGDFYDFMDR